jgi:iron complex transport system substrate-binding protein
MAIDRRRLLGGLSASVLVSRVAQAAIVTDAAGRAVTIPEKVERIFPAGPPAAILLYTLAPELLLGWTRSPEPGQCAFLGPGACDKPEVGRLTGRGNTTNLEVLLNLKPDLVLDVGTINDTYVSLATRVQEQSGIPYALLDGHFDAVVPLYRKLGELTHRPDRAEALARYADETIKTIKSRIDTVSEAQRPRVYYGRGPNGLETGLGGSINVETIEFLGAHNVAAERRGGLATVSVEQVLAWNPEVIITIEPAFATTVRTDPVWAPIKAVQTARIYLSPRLPFGWVDFPPSVNRLIGLWWLAKALYPDRFPEDLRPLTREFYQRFYHMTPGDAQIENVLSGQG